jgi:multidrug efflux pump subunit AcrA (membrane-fusion protein)
LADKKSTAEFKLNPTDGAAFKADQSISLKAADGSAIPGRVVKVEPSAAAVTVTAEILDEKVKPDEELHLVKGDVKDLISVPVSALTKVNGADTIYVLTGGEAHERHVTVADRSGTDALISNGLNIGDSVIVSNTSALHDGQHAVTP